MAFWVYILRCADGSYCVGHADDIELGLAKHQAGEFAGYTRTRLPVELTVIEEFASRSDAFVRERQIKGWSRKKKEGLIRNDWTELSRLARPSTVREASRQASSTAFSSEPFEESGRAEK